MGYGLSVIQRLIKTSVKKNLYWEIKDRVSEEKYVNGVKQKIVQKVRVHGTNSTKEVRARLIDILRERVELHKDKFVAPIIYNEMKAMEVKKSGKVEHSQNSHDDQVFSYLMALYVWYDGQNLAENFGIVKNTLKTDQNIDIEELNLEDELEVTDKVDIEPFTYDIDDEIYQVVSALEKDCKVITSREMRNQQYLELERSRNDLLYTDKRIREAYCKQTGIDPSMYEANQGNMFVSLPDEMFTDENFGLYDDDMLLPPNNVLQGNLSQWWDSV